MIKITTIVFVSTDDAEKFTEMVAERVRETQIQGEQVEIQYGMSAEGLKSALFTALIIGRKEADE